MASLINPSKPTDDNGLVRDIRDNFAIAKLEIEALQNGKISTTSPSHPALTSGQIATASNVAAVTTTGVVLGPSGARVEQLKVLNPIGAISSSDFSNLYTTFGSVDKIIRYLNSINFKGRIDVPSGTFEFGTGYSDKPWGIDMSAMYLRGNGSANTTLNFPYGDANNPIWNSVLNFGDLTVTTVGNPLNMLEFRMCTVNTSEGGTAAPLTVFESQVVISKESIASLEGATIKGGLVAGYGSTVHADGGELWVSAAAATYKNATALYAYTGSYVQAVGANIRNPNSVASSSGVFADTLSKVNISNAVIGTTGQTISAGVSVLAISDVIAISATFQGTVTTQYSQDINVRTNSGLILF